jgi:hypothetical protein
MMLLGSKHVVCRSECVVGVERLFWAGWHVAARLERVKQWRPDESLASDYRGESPPIDEAREKSAVEQLDLDVPRPKVANRKRETKDQLSATNGENRLNEGFGGLQSN